MKQSLIIYKVASLPCEWSFIDSMYRIIKFESHSNGYFIVNYIRRHETIEN